MRTLAGFFFWWVLFWQEFDLVQFLKPALTVPEQLQLLKRRGMSIANDERALRALQNVNYYRLRAYWRPFERPDADSVGGVDHQFAPSADFDQVFSLYVFDRRLRLLLLEGIERVEIALRTYWAQALAQRYGAHAYLDTGVFNSQNLYQTCLASLDTELGRSKETFVQHYFDTYQTPTRPPIWAICELLTLGQLSKWIGNIKLRPDRQAVAAPLGLDEKLVCAFAHHLTQVRNLCAHHSRVWNRKFMFTMQVPKRPVDLAQQFHDNESRRVYNTLVMLAWCTETISPNTSWTQRVAALLAERSDPDLRAMGAPKDWKERAPWASD